MQPWLDAGADGFGLGGGLYKPGQSPAETLAKARAYVAGAAGDEADPDRDHRLTARSPATSMCPRSPAIRASSWSRPRAARAGRRSQAFTDWRELIRSVEGLRSGRDHHAARPALRDCARMHRSPGSIACSKSRRPPAWPRSPTSTASPRRSGVSLFTTWHAQHHSTVDAAAQALAGKRITVDGDPVARGRPQMASGPALDLGAGRLRRVRPRHQRLLDRDQDLPRRPVRRVGRASASPRMRRRRSPPRSTFSSPEADGPLTASLDWRRTEGEEWTIAVDDRRRTMPSASRTAGRGCCSTARSGRTTGTGEYPDIYRAFVRPDRRAAQPGRRRAVAAGRRLPAGRQPENRRSGLRLMEQLSELGIINGS